MSERENREAGLSPRQIKIKRRDTDNFLFCQ